jgi:hypothetical protein
LGYLINKADKYNINIPISKKIWKKMKEIEREINQSLVN